MSRFVPHFNKKFAAAAVLSVICLHPATLGAFPFGRSEKSGSTELRLGDTAASLGDTEQAEKYYSKAMSLSKEKNISLWRQCVSRLGTLYLSKNDIASAKKLLEEFREMLPADSAGTLPGEIMAAENRFAEAEKLFRDLISRNDVSADKAKFCLGEVLFKQQKFSQAYEIFDSLRKSVSELWVRRSEYALVRTLIYMNKFAEAKALLNKFSANSNDINLKKLRLQCAVQEGDLEYFKKNIVSGDTELRADDDLYNLAGLAAEAAIKKADYKTAAEFYDDAFMFAPTPDKQRESISNAFSCYAYYDADAAAKEAERYARLFPESNKRDELILRAGSLLADKGNFAEAVKFYLKVADDKNSMAMERSAAAFGGAIAAEKGKFFPVAERLHKLHVTLAQSLGNSERAKLDYAEYFIRQNKLVQAEEILQGLIPKANFDDTAMQAAYRLLQTKIKLNKLSKKELPLADKLGKSKNIRYSETGAFADAEIHRIAKGNHAAGRKKYQDFIAKYPQSKFVIPAKFHAAHLAGKAADYIVAAKEFISFAEQYADHKNAGAAQLMALDYFCRADQAAQAENILKKLAAAPKYSEQYVSGILRLGEYLLLRGKGKEALQLVQKGTFPESQKLLNSRADILYLEARILDLLKEHKSAVAKLEKLSAEHSTAPEFCEANLLAGNICFDKLQDFAAAEKCFKRAKESAKNNSVFYYIAKGRHADSLFQTGDKKSLASAEQSYREIANNAPIPSMRLQAAYKAALCSSEYDKFQAMTDCKELLYSALELKNQGIVPEQLWCEKAAYMGANIALNLRNGSEAQSIYLLYRNLKFADSSDFVKLRGDLYKRIKQLNRGE